MRALLLLPLLALVGCQSESADVSVTAPAGATVAADAGETSVVVVGDPVGDVAAVTTADLVAEALLRRGLVPRTFGAGHPLAGHLRVTVRSAEEDDRLIEAAREIEHGRPIEEATA